MDESTYPIKATDRNFPAVATTDCFAAFSFNSLAAPLMFPFDEKRGAGDINLLHYTFDSFFDIFRGGTGCNPIPRLYAL